LETGKQQETKKKKKKKKKTVGELVDLIQTASSEQ